MKRKNLTWICLALIALVGPVLAHPLGNFSINQFTRIEIGTSQIRLRQIVDLAEIPVVQQAALIDTDKNGVYSAEELQAYVDRLTPGYVQHLKLLVDGNEVSIRPIRDQAYITPGAADLPTLNMTWDLVADLPTGIKSAALHFENQNFADRIGWNEIIANQSVGVSVYNSTAFASGASSELKAYPADRLQSPLAERTADLSFVLGAAPAGVEPLRNRDGKPVVAAERDRFAELISISELTPAVALFGILLALGFGALHAMSPGHGKTVVGAYLVGSRGTLKHALFLGLTVTVTHTLGVFAIGIITLFASSYLSPERIMPYLSFASGLMVFAVGLSLFNTRLRGFLRRTVVPHHHDHSHQHGHDQQVHRHEGHSHSLAAHTHSHNDHSHSHDDHRHSHGDHSHSNDELTHTHGGSTHSHMPPKDISWRSLLALGVSGGLLPCPSALVLMLSAISLGRIGYGLVLTVAFSFGLAATLTGVGIVFLYLGKLFGGTSLSQYRAFRVVPILSALVIACVGAAICYTSLA